LKANKITHLYAKLTPHEQAALAFEAAVRQDDSEITRILDSVERETYVTLHTDYKRRAYGLRALCTEYGLHYWRNQCFQMSSLALHIVNEDDSYLALCISFDAKLVAMDMALAEVCNDLKISVEAVKKTAYCQDTSQYIGLSDAPIDEEIVKNYKMLFLTAGKL
jgi:hypothetical protein